jgi:hypothetical protein
VVVTVAVNISAVALMMGDRFLGGKAYPKKMGVTGVAGLLNGKFGHNEIRVLILKCWIRVKIGSGLSVSDSELSDLVGLFSPAYSSLEWCHVLSLILY